MQNEKKKEKRKRKNNDKKVHSSGPSTATNSELLSCLILMDFVPIHMLISNQLMDNIKLD